MRARLSPHNCSDLHMDQITKFSSPLDCSENGNLVQVGEKQLRYNEELEESALSLELRLEALKAACQQKLKKSDLEHQAGLDKRVLQNSLLTSSTDWARTDKLQKSPSIQYGGNTESIKQHSSAMSFSIKSPTMISLGIIERPKKPVPQETLKAKEEADLAECQKQFRVAPVPPHVSKLSYDDIIITQERLRKKSHDQRKDFLLTLQKPFSFLEREKMQEKASAKTTEKAEPVCVRKPVSKAVADPRFFERLEEQEQQRKIRIHQRAQETLRASSAPVQHHNPSAQKTKSKILGYLDQRPSFSPKTNTAVPDFDKLYKDFQQKAAKAAERRDATRCKPFNLRTSIRQSQHRSSEDEDVLKTSEVKMTFKRSSSSGCLTSLSKDTLPVYITDSARKRSVAVRKSLELKDLQEKENAEWMRQHRLKSRAMSRALVMRAKAMDPHKGLKEVYQEKIRQHRQADLERMKDYQRELKEIRSRVTARPYLFEQLSQNNAKIGIERRYRNALTDAGLKESFVKSKAEAYKEITRNHRKDSPGQDDSSSERGTQHSSGSGKDSPQNEPEKEGDVEAKEEESC